MAPAWPARTRRTPCCGRKLSPSRGSCPADQQIEAVHSLRCKASSTGQCRPALDDEAGCRACERLQCLACFALVGTSSQASPAIDMRAALVSLVVHLAACAAVTSKADLGELLAAQRELLGRAVPNQLCSALSAERLGQLNLTAREQAVLPSICWQDSWQSLAPVIPSSDDRAIPPDVTCTVTQWCARAGLPCPALHSTGAHPSDCGCRCDGPTCTDVCERGSVRVEPWLANAIRTQARCRTGQRWRPPLRRALTGVRGPDPACQAPAVLLRNPAGHAQQRHLPGRRLRQPGRRLSALLQVDQLGGAPHLR